MSRAAARLALLALLAAASQPERGVAGEPDWNAIGAEAARALSGYVQIDTTNPPGNELAGALYLKRFFDAEGIASQLYESAPGRATLVARLPATGGGAPAAGPVLLLSHIDVVPADPSAWSFPPFSGAIENGAVYGRGAIDDKGQGIAHAFAFALLHRLGTPLDRDFVFAATASEEAGLDVGADWMVEHHWDALGPPVVVWNEGGLSTHTPIASGRILNAISNTEKRALWMTLRATGEGGHGSQPIPNGASDRVVRALYRIETHPTPLHITPTVEETLRRTSLVADFPLSFALRNISNPLVLRLVQPEFERSRVTNAMVRDTIALTGLRAGQKHNVIPRTAEAMLDVRLLPDTDANAFLGWLKQVIDDPSVEIQLEPDGDVTAFRSWRQRVLGDPDAPVPESPVDNELFHGLESELANDFPDALSVPLQTTGGSDSKWFRARGVPAYGYLPALGDDALLATIHGVDERMPVAELTRAVRLEYRTLVRLAR